MKVNDEFAELNSLAVFRCRPSASLEFSSLIEWFTSDGIQIGAGETSAGKASIHIYIYILITQTSEPDSGGAPSSDLGWQNSSLNRAGLNLPTSGRGAKRAPSARALRRSFGH